MLHVFVTLTSLTNYGLFIPLLALAIHFESRLLWSLPRLRALTAVCVPLIMLYTDPAVRRTVMPGMVQLVAELP
jgi:hypothetical protein